MENEPVNIHDINKDRKRYEAGVRKNMDSSEISEENKKDFEKFLLIKRVKKKVSYGKLAGYCTIFFNFSSKFFPNKRLIELEENDYLFLCANLEDGIFQSNKGIKYGTGTINSMKTFFRAYMNEMIGKFETEKRFGRFEIKRDKINTRAKYLKFEDVKEVINKIPFENQEIKFLIAFMFSTGCRSQDVRNLKVKDIYIDDEGDLMVALPELKTFGRDIEINVFKPEIEYYLNYIKTKLKRNDDDLILSYRASKPITIQLINRKLKEFFVSILGEDYSWVSSHKLRHSSSIYFSSKQGMNYQQFCHKFGWSVNSITPALYFNKNALGKTKFKEMAKNDEIQKYEFQNIELKEKVNKLEENEVGRKNEVDTLKEEFEKIKKLLLIEKAPKYVMKPHLMKLKDSKTNKITQVLFKGNKNFEEFQIL